MKNVLYVLLVILSVALIIIVLMQPGKTDGLNSLLTGNTDTFFAKNKSRTKESMLTKLTMIIALLFAIVVLALGIID